MERNTSHRVSESYTMEVLSRIVELREKKRMVIISISKQSWIDL